jgi:hypothetical protein
VVVLPTIQRILDAEPAAIIEKTRADIRYFFMRTGLPLPLDTAVVAQAWAQLNTKDLARLEDLLKTHQVLVQADDGGLKVKLETLRAFWHSHCVVVVQPRTIGPSTKCSCFHHRRRGHCPHQYAIMDKLQIAVFPKALPSAADAPKTLVQDGDGSSQEAAPRARARAKAAKRKRPNYVPHPVPVPAPEVGPSQDKPVPRVLPVQKAKRSVFER